MIDAEPLIRKIRSMVRSHRIAPGEYTRFTLTAETGMTAPANNPYGCADAANIRYAIGDFPSDEEERRACIRGIRKFQDPKSGLFHDVAAPGFYCHHPYHTTAHCMAALELFDALPEYPLTDLKPYADFPNMAKMMDGLDWLEKPWSESHCGAGVYSALVISGMADAAWRKEFFAYLDRHADPEYGMSRAGTIQTGKERISHHLNGWFHYLFCYNHANMAFPYPDKLIDTCLSIYEKHDMDKEFGQTADFQEIDWVFPLSRAIRQTPHRFEEVKAVLKDFAAVYIPTMIRIDPAADVLFDDLHSLFGMLCCLCELYLALPGEIHVEKPLKNPLDRRPFI